MCQLRGTKSSSAVIFSKVARQKREILRFHSRKHKVEVFLSISTSPAFVCQSTAEIGYQISFIILLNPINNHLSLLLQIRPNINAANWCRPIISDFQFGYFRSQVLTQQHFAVIISLID